MIVVGFGLVATDADSTFFGRVPSGLYFGAWVLGLLAVGTTINSKRDA